MDESERLRRISRLRDRLDSTRADLLAEIAAAAAEGIRTGPISRAAGWSEAYIRRLRQQDGAAR